MKSLKKSDMVVIEKKKGRISKSLDLSLITFQIKLQHFRHLNAFK